MTSRVGRMIHGLSCYCIKILLPLPAVWLRGGIVGAQG